MLRCHFVRTDRPDHHRCNRCGFLIGPVRCPPERCHRECDAIPLQPEADAGLGDTVARWLRPLSRILGLESCGACKKRQARLNQWWPYEPVELTSDQRTLLLRFPHGFGDAVQLTSVLEHLRHQAPEWQVDVASRPGTQALYRGLSRAQYVLGQEPKTGYGLARTLAWYEPDALYTDSPSTKAERCLREVFHLAPVPDHCTYHVAIDEPARQAAARYVASLGGGPIACIHYQGHSSRGRKDLTERDLVPLLAVLAARGIQAVILDWDGRTPLADGQAVHCPGRGHWLWAGRDHADSAVLAALLEQSALNVGIDSGPGHLMGAVPRPTIIVWHRHHPLHYYGLADHVTHLVPTHHLRLLRPGDSAAALEYLDAHYDVRTYLDRPMAIAAAAVEKLDRGPLQIDGDCLVRREHRAADLVIVRDVYQEDCYRAADLRPPRYVVDVGAHIGTFARLAHRRWPRAAIACIEPHPDNLEALGANVGDFAHIVPAACTYQPGPLKLLSSIFEGSDNTGASRVVPEAAATPRPGYADQPLAVDTITLEGLVERLGWPRIDVLKLDCEGAEESILAAADLDRLRVRVIVGEWHDPATFQKMLQRFASGWRIEIMRPGDNSLFRLTRSRNSRSR